MVSAEGLGFFCIDEDGYVVWASSSCGQILHQLTVCNKQAHWPKVLPVWNTRLWQLVATDKNQEQLCRPVDPDYDLGIAGMVMWSRQAPEKLNVCLMPLEKMGIEIDSSWKHLLLEIAGVPKSTGP